MSDKKVEMVEMGFAIDLGTEDLIEANAHDMFSSKFGDKRDRAQALKMGVIDEKANLTKKGWDWVNSDIAKFERNVMKWLRQKFDGARDEGHAGGGNEELVGTLFVDMSKRAQVDLLGKIWGDDGYELNQVITLWDGLSALGAIIDGRLFIQDVPEDVLDVLSK